MRVKTVKMETPSDAFSPLEVSFDFICSPARNFREVTHIQLGEEDDEMIKRCE